MDWQAIDGDNSLQGVFLADPGIKATIERTLGVDDIWKTPGDKYIKTQNNKICLKEKAHVCLFGTNVLDLTHRNFHISSYQVSLALIITQCVTGTGPRTTSTVTPLCPRLLFFLPAASNTSACRLY